jgi:hypothetical protein
LNKMNGEIKIKKINSDNKKMERVQYKFKKPLFPINQNNRVENPWLNRWVRGGSSMDAPSYSWEYGARCRLAPSGGSWLCSESSRSGYVAIVHKYYLFSSPKHCIHKLLDARNKAAKKQRTCKAKKRAYSSVGMLKSMRSWHRTQVA